MTRIGKKLNVSGAALAAAAIMMAVVLAGVGLVGPASAQTATKQKTAGETFKNVTTPALKALTVDDFMGAMGVISADLGLDCADCHPGAGSDKANFVIDTPQKITARKMINMVGAINQANFNGVQNVTCWTCHHGKETPANTITLDKLYGTPNDEHDDFVAQQPGEPKGAEVLDKYIAAVGGAAKLATLKSFIATGTSVGYEGLGGGGSFQIFAKAPDQRTTLIVFKDHPERGDNTRVYNGTAGWIKSPRGLFPEFELTGSELDGARLDAMMSFPGQIKQVLN